MREHVLVRGRAVGKMLSSNYWNPYGTLGMHGRRSGLPTSAWPSVIDNWSHSTHSSGPLLRRYPSARCKQKEKKQKGAVVCREIVGPTLFSEATVYPTETQTPRLWLVVSNSTPYTQPSPKDNNTTTDLLFVHHLPMSLFTFPCPSSPSHVPLHLPMSLFTSAFPTPLLPPNGRSDTGS